MGAVQVQPSWDPQSVGYIRPEPDLYNCPVYLTTFRGPTWVFVATLKTDKPGLIKLMIGQATLMHPFGLSVGCLTSLCLFLRIVRLGSGRFILKGITLP